MERRPSPVGGLKRKLVPRESGKPKGGSKKLIKETKEYKWKNFIKEEGKKGAWTMAYKIGFNKLKTDMLYNSLKIDNKEIIKISEVAETLLEKLLPDDNLETETQAHSNIRRQIKEPPDSDNTGKFSKHELEYCLKSLGRNKAPGRDGITAEMIYKGGDKIKEVLLGIYNDCLDNETFPNKWKTAYLRTIPKGRKKDKNKIKAYRPLCLLPVMGKIYEKLILTIWIPKRKKHQRSINSALNHAINSKFKAVLGLFTDIQGAFDNVWWPNVLHSLKEMNCAKNIYKTIQNYLEHRTCNFKISSKAYRKKLTKGCPQGSVLGPTLWNIVMNNCLKTRTPEHINKIAYADDLLIIIHGSSRADIERKAAIEIENIETWCNTSKLNISEEKT
ncbi:hypothetical protein J437_LFUL006121, partial [Ladona fulva]